MLKPRKPKKQSVLMEWALLKRIKKRSFTSSNRRCTVGYSNHSIWMVFKKTGTIPTATKC